MDIAYLVITVLTALAIGYAASLSIAGADSVRIVADRVQVSQTWMLPLGMVLAAGAVGLLAGFAVPVLGTAAATGLVLYFVCAIGAHVRARDTGIGGAAFFLALAACALATSLAHHGPR